MSEQNCDDDHLCNHSYDDDDGDNNGEIMTIRMMMMKMMTMRMMMMMMTIIMMYRSVYRSVPKRVFISRLASYAPIIMLLFSAFNNMSRKW